MGTRRGKLAGAFLWLSVGVAIAACSSGDTDPMEMMCGLNDPCPAGFTCDPVTNRCVRSSGGVDAAVPDAPLAPDAPIPDAPLPDAPAPDAPTPDAPPPADAGPPDAPPGPTFIPAVFSQPISITYDGSGHVWTADRGTALLQKIDVRAATPGVVAAVNLAPLGVETVREIRYDPGSGHLFAAAHDSRLVVIVNKTTAAVIGKVLLGDRARATVTDGAGNFFAAESPAGGDTSVLHKFSIAATLAAYPANGTATASYPYDFHIENMTFGGGFIWAGGGVQNYIHPPVLNVYQQGYGSVLMRINPATGALVTARSDMNRWVWNAYYAFGSVWAGSSGPDLQRWSPATFSPQMSPGNPLYVAHPTDSAAAYHAGMMTGEFVEGAGRLWMGCTLTDKRIHSLDPANNTITVHLVSNFFDAAYDSLTFDGTSVWGTARFESDVGVYRFSDADGNIIRGYRILDGANGTAWFSSIDKAVGPSAGGVTVKLRGGGLATATGVLFNVTQASCTVDNDTTITCVTPPLGGAVNPMFPFADVTIQRPGGDLVWTGAYRYQ
jgi:hypothetical protein